jgi:hypothetical protein
MAKTVPLEIRVADLPQMQQFICSAATLLRALARYDDLPLPQPVMAAIDQLRRQATALGGDISAPSGEDRIRDAMVEAQAHPGRVVTR